MSSCSLCDEPAQPASLSSEPIQVKQITNEDLISTLANMKPQSNSITHQINQNALHALQQLELHDEMANGLQTTAAAKMSLTQNRQQMILPFDMNRVVLQNRQNDYINCSRINTGSNAVPTALGKVQTIALDRKTARLRIWALKTPKFEKSSKEKSKKETIKVLSRPDTVSKRLIRVFVNFI